MRGVEFRERLIAALFTTAQAKGLAGFLDPREVADAFGLERHAGQLRLVVDDLESRGLVDASRTLGGGDEGGLDLRLTHAAIEEAEDLLERHPEYGVRASAAEEVPGSDRYVTLTHNQRADVTADVSALRSAVLATNDAELEEREAALSEIAIFEATIAQSRVPVELVERFVNRVLAWILRAFGEAMVAAVVGKLMAKLLPLLG